MQPSLLKAQNLHVNYPSRAALQGIQFSLAPGEWISLIGPNGSGKSTLLKSLSGLLPFQQGIVWLDGNAIHSLPPKQVAQQLAMLPQHQELPNGLTVEQLVSLGRSPYQTWWQWTLTSADREKVTLCLDQTQLDGLRDRPLETLSGGERQRAFLALALAQDPQVLLLDEPTTFLDLRYQIEILDVLKYLNQAQGLALVTVLHDVNLAARYSDRLALLYEGQLQIIGHPEQVLTSHHLVDVFGIEVVVVSTPVGLQICPMGLRASPIDQQIKRLARQACGGPES